MHTDGIKFNEISATIRTRRNFGLRVSAAKRIFYSFHTVAGFNKISKHSKSHVPPLTQCLFPTHFYKEWGNAGPA